MIARLTVYVLIYLFDMLIFVFVILTKKKKKKKKKRKKSINNNFPHSSGTALFFL